MTRGQATYSGINSNAEAYFDGAADATGPRNKPTGVTISLTTPFIYAPKRGVTEAADFCESSLSIGKNEAHGYVPQTLIDYLAAHPVYKSAYPGVVSCLPGGPSIKPCGACDTIIGTEVNALPSELTAQTVSTVTPDGQSPTQPAGSTTSPVSGATTSPTPEQQPLSSPVTSHLPPPTAVPALPGCLTASVTPALQQPTTSPSPIQQEMTTPEVVPPQQPTTPKSTPQQGTTTPQAASP